MIPKPHRDHAGVNNTDPGGKKGLAWFAKFWQPKNANNESAAATVSRYAMRLIDRATGKAYSADEIAPTAANTLTALEAMDTGQQADAREALGITDSEGNINASVAVSDNSGVALGERVLSGGAAVPSLSVHDGEREGGHPIPVGYDDFHVRGLRFATRANLNSANQLLELGRLVIPRDKYTDGRIIYVQGKVVGGQYGGAGSPAYASNWSLGFHIDGEDDAIGAEHKGARIFEITANQDDQHSIEFSGYLALTLDGGFYRISASVQLGGVLSRVGAAAAALPAVAGPIVPTTTAPQYSDLVVTARFLQDASFASADGMFMSVDLKMFFL